jgi:hypothetical protein
MCVSTTHSGREQAGFLVNRWLILDVSMPIYLPPFRPMITASSDNENLRTMAWSGGTPKRTPVTMFPPRRIDHRLV